MVPTLAMAARLGEFLTTDFMDLHGLEGSYEICWVHPVGERRKFNYLCNPYCPLVRFHRHSRKFAGFLY